MPGIKCEWKICYKKPGLSSFEFWYASKKPTLDLLSLQDNLGINLLGSWALWDSSSAKLVPNAADRKQASPLRSEKPSLI